MHYLNPFRKPRPNPKREEARRVRGRVRLNRKELGELRERRWQHAGGKCEKCGKAVPLEGELTQRAHLAHNEHGARKSDEFHRVKIKCYECHIVKEHGGGKVVKKKPGRAMNTEEGKTYWLGTFCYTCEGKKKPQSAFCDECMSMVSAQSRLDLERLTGKPWLKAVGDAEKEILEARRIAADSGARENRECV